MTDGAVIHSDAAALIDRAPFFGAVFERLRESLARLSRTESLPIASFVLARELDGRSARALALLPRRADLLECVPDGERALRWMLDLEKVGVLVGERHANLPWFAEPLRVRRALRDRCLGCNSSVAQIERCQHLRRVDEALSEALSKPQPVFLWLKGAAIETELVARMAAATIVAQPRWIGDPLEASSALEECAMVGDVPVLAHPSPRPGSLGSEAFPLVVGRGEQAPPHESWRRHRLVSIEVEPRTLGERQESWSLALPSSPLAIEMGARTAAGVCSARRAVRRTSGLTPRALHRSLAEALGLGQMLGARLEDECEERMDELVLTREETDGVEQLAALARLHGSGDGADRVGVRALLAGPPGTGKSFTARALAAELGAPLLRVDLSSVVSKWVGETEKNLARVLAGAARAGAVLLFDEGDALFGRRGEVQRGSDRYANLEVSYLLQEVERFDGILLLTTNSEKSLDAAFLRRFDLCLRFAPPEASARRLLWKRKLPKLAPPAVALVERLAEEVEITGGHIATAARMALSSARAHGREAPDETDITRSVAAELRKIGRGMAAAHWQPLGGSP